MQAREVGILQGDLADHGAPARDEVDDAVGQARFLEELHEVVVRQDRGGGGLPDHGVAHDGGRRGEVGADGREVEGRHGEDEAFERPVVHAVPHVGIRDGLLPVDVLHELRVEAEEVRRLAGAVDLRLIGALRLVQHGGGVEDVAVLRGDEAGHLVEDGGAVLPGRGFPGLLGGQGGGKGLVHLGLARLVVGGQYVLVIVGADGLLHVPRADFLPADDERNVDDLVVLALQFRLQQRPLLRPWGVGEDGFVVGFGEAEDRVGHALSPSGLRFREAGIREE